MESNIRCRYVDKKKTCSKTYQVQYQTELGSTPCLERQCRGFHTHLIGERWQVLDETVPSFQHTACILVLRQESI